jgi:hypothetical protein
MHLTMRIILCHCLSICAALMFVLILLETLLHENQLFLMSYPILLGQVFLLKVFLSQIQDLIIVIKLATTTELGVGAEILLITEILIRILHVCLRPDLRQFKAPRILYGLSLRSVNTV